MKSPTASEIGAVCVHFSTDFGKSGACKHRDIIVQSHLRGQGYGNISGNSSTAIRMSSYDLWRTRIWREHRTVRWSPLTTRAKIGLVVVSASTVSELRYPRAAPEVGFLASRMMLGGDNGLEALLEMEKKLLAGGGGARVRRRGLHRLLLHGERGAAGVGEGPRVLRRHGAPVRSTHQPPRCWPLPRRCSTWASGGWC